MTTKRLFFLGALCAATLTSQTVSADPLNSFLTLCGDGMGALPSPWMRNGADISYTPTNGKVGIQTNAPQYQLDVSGTVRATSFRQGESTLEELFLRKNESNSVTNSMLANGSVTTAKLANEAVTFVKIADNAVGTQKLAEKAVTRMKLADNAVSTTQIADESVTTSKLAPGAVTSAKIAPGAISSSLIQSSQIQKRINGTCAPGSTVRAVNEDGSVSCTLARAWMPRIFCGERTNPLNTCPEGWTQYGPAVTNPAGLSNCEEFTTVICFQDLG